MSLRRWFASTSNRTFIVWPVLLFAVEALLRQGLPRIEPLGFLLLGWGYLQYRWVGVFRTREGGGGPGISKPPVRLVTTGPYRWTRNPMYLGHLIFFAGIAITLLSWVAAAVLVVHAVWFDRRVREDEERLAQLFGDGFRDYCRRVNRWIPLPR